MADDDKKSAEVKTGDNYYTIPDGTPSDREMTLAANSQSVPSLSVRSVRVIPDPVNRSPNGLPLDIVEVELYPHNQGNGTWMQWRDLARFVCERGDAEKLLTAMGLKAK